MPSLWLKCVQGLKVRTKLCTDYFWENNWKKESNIWANISAMPSTTFKLQMQAGSKCIKGYTCISDLEKFQVHSVKNSKITNTGKKKRRQNKTGTWKWDIIDTSILNEVSPSQPMRTTVCRWFPIPHYLTVHGNLKIRRMPTTVQLSSFPLALQLCFHW